MATHAGALEGIQQRRGFIERLNGEWHERALMIFGGIIVLHWAEHLAQAFQIWVLGYKKPEARGLLGQQWPWLQTSEWLHWGFAAIMIVGLALLMPGFTGRARFFWGLALGIQIWHFVEHQILWLQYQTGDFWFGAKAPTSVLQQFWPMARPELHLVYNALVTIPMIIAIYFHLYPPLSKRGQETACTCDKTAGKVNAAAADDAAIAAE